MSSITTTRAVYPNPYLDGGMQRLGLSENEIDDLAPNPDLKNPALLGAY
jgi:hypothetical protein